MATGRLPTSGQISLRAITEIKNLSLSNRSLATLATTDINPYSPTTPGSTSPYIISSWYGYIHGTYISASATYSSNSNVSFSFNMSYGRLTAIEIDAYPSWTTVSNPRWSQSGLSNTFYSKTLSWGGAGAIGWYPTSSPQPFDFTNFIPKCTCTFGSSGSIILEMLFTSPPYYAGSGSQSVNVDSNTWTL